MLFQENKPFVLKPPVLIVAIVALSIILSESLAMLLLHFWPVKSALLELITDASLLLVFISPILYFYLFRPMENQIFMRQQVEELLLKAKEEQIQNIIGTSLDGFWVTDKHGQILEVNIASCQMLGYSRNEMLNMHIYDVQAVESKEDTTKRINELMEIGSALFEMNLCHRDGNILNIEVNCNYNKINGEKVYYFLRDITERKRLEDTLRKSESTLKEMFENLSLGVAMYRASEDGQDFFFTNINRAAERIDNIHRQQLIGKNVTMVFPGITEFRLLEAFRRVYASGEPENVPSTFYHDERLQGWRKNYVYKLSEGDIVVIYEDVSNQHLSEENM